MPAIAFTFSHFFFSYFVVAKSEEIVELLAEFLPGFATAAFKSCRVL